MAQLIELQHLARHCNPFQGTRPWRTRVTRSAVQQALAENRLVGEPGTTDHAGRIAYLVKHPADDAISIDVGVPHLGCNVSWFVQDGNHRVAAALYRGESLIEAELSGSVDYLRELFGVEPD